MAHTKPAYERPDLNHEASKLIADLVSLSKKSPKLVKSSRYPAPSESNVLVTSWKMNEFKYYDIPSPFPTYARGLFSLELPRHSEDDDPRYRIVARGYDKFFNIGEVPWTEWAFLESHTRPPYILSLKSNGCIIFIGALTPSKLITTSKHSIGPVEGQERSHAQVGEAWLRRYIEQQGKTEADLAKQLWENNWTAIAELCDDSFEEHILPYPPERTGLYLHGINFCTKEFSTLPPSTVDAFAEEWGFVKTKCITLKTISQVCEFTDEIRETGTWEGEPIEGFVVRTHITEPPKASSTSQQGTVPYNAGSTFFFKIKFDEPYLLYRDWREVTKSLLTMQAKSGTMDPRNLPKSKMRREETKIYVNWAINEIKRNPQAFARYQHNQGIIKTREMFLEWRASNKGEKLVEEEEPNDIQESSKTIIVPVAIPGSGKTAISVALAHVFGFAHTQSDDVRAKKPGPAFVRNVMDLLQNHSVVIADKNNHLRQHRSTLRDGSANLTNKKKVRKQNGKKKASVNGDELASPTPTRVRLLALYWDVSSPPSATVFQACAERVRSRGSNHQTLRVDSNSPLPSQQNSSGAELYEDVIWKFIRETQELSPSEVDGIIEMTIGEGLEESIRRAVSGIVKELGLPTPDGKKVQEGIDKAKSYMVAEEKKKPSETARQETKPPRYYGFLPDLDLVDVLDPFFSSIETGPEALSFWHHLKKGGQGRLSVRPHVTIVHKTEVQQRVTGAQELWDRCANLISEDNDRNILFLIHLTHVVWDGRVMALAVDSILVLPKEGEDDLPHDLAKNFVDSLTDQQQRRLHVTVGTRDNDVLPIEANALVQGWRQGECKEERKVLKLGDAGVTVKSVISGLFT
ncbi:RNA ligase [Amanita muscaria]